MLRGVETSPAQARGPASLPFRLHHLDPTSPLDIDVTIVGWQARGVSGLGADVFWCALGDGLLHDADKGLFPLAGLELTLEALPGGALEPGAITNPGVLSEFQQAWLLDAVCSVLNERR